MQEIHNRSVTSIAALLCFVLLSGFWNSASAAKTATIAGTVAYRERIALFPDATVHVLLVDLSSKSSDFLIAHETLKPKGQVPIPFKLQYNPSAIKPDRNYGIRAMIEDREGKIRWTTPKAVPVFRSDTKQRVEVLLSQATNTTTQTYLTESLRFRAIFANRKTQLILPGGKNVTLRQVAAASGAKYTNGPLTFWTKGSEAMITVGGISLPAKAQKLAGRGNHYIVEGIRFSASFEEDFAWLTLPNAQQQVLKSEPTARGAKYSNPGLNFWSKGTEALIEFYGIWFQAKQVPAGPWEKAKKNGVEFRAVGQEPGWVLELKGEQLDLVTDYGQTRICAQLDAPVVDPKTGTKTYRALSGALKLTIKIQDKIHYDIMSGEPFPASVIINLNGLQYQGGGRML